MNKPLILIFLAFSCVLFSCEKKITIVSPGPELKAVDSLNLNTHQQGGTDSTGGGSVIQGKAVDDYIYDIRELPAFNNYLVPLIEDLKVNYPELAGDFYHIINERDWYFLPTTLDQIAKNILGIYARTDQVALQDVNKILFDSKKFDEMSDLDQAILIVHEILMGIRLMPFQHAQDQCKAIAYQKFVSHQDLVQLQKEKVECRKKNPRLPGTLTSQFNLNSSDYDFIRKLVKKVTSKNVDYTELRSLIEDNKFRSYKD